MPSARRPRPPAWPTRPRIDLEAKGPNFSTPASEARPLLVRSPRTGGGRLVSGGMIRVITHPPEPCLGLSLASRLDGKRWAVRSFRRAPRRRTHAARSHRCKGETMKIANDVTELIGNTPLVRLPKLTQ